MDSGLIILNMVMSGRQISAVDSSHTVPQVIGYGLMNTSGSGFLITRGAGRLFTTGVGFMIHFTDGCGYRVTNGRLHGCRGEQAAIIMDGHRSLRVSASALALAITTLHLTIGVLLPGGILIQDISTTII